MVVVNCYDKAFKVTERWLKEHTGVKNVDDFLDTYTYDDGEYLYLDFLADCEEIKIKYLYGLMQEGYSCFKSINQEGILHASTKDKGYQFSYFDKQGAVGDIQKITLYEMAEAVYH